MKRRTHTASAVLFAFLLVLPGSVLAHDDEHQAKDGHDSSEFYEEGSGMKMHSEKHGEYKEHGEYEKHENPSGRTEEGSSMKMKEKNHADYQEHGEYEKHGKPSEHAEEGSGMR